MDFKKLREQYRLEHLKTQDFIGTLDMVTNAFIKGEVLDFDQDDMDQLREQAKKTLGYTTKNTYMVMHIIDQMEDQMGYSFEK